MQFISLPSKWSTFIICNCNILIRFKHFNRTQWSELKCFSGSECEVTEVTRLLQYSNYVPAGQCRNVCFGSSTYDLTWLLLGPFTIFVPFLANDPLAEILIQYMDLNFEDIIANQYTIIKLTSRAIQWC